ncbi:MAG: tetratricopeptide repeat protein [Candidatus Thorarchaeota archaeon]
MADKKKLQLRKKYRVKDVLTDLKMIDPTPSVTYRIGSELVYFEWNCCIKEKGPESDVTVGLGTLLNFMQYGYEKQLLDGDLHKATDTTKAAMNRAAKELPKEALVHEFSRSPQYIHGLLLTAKKLRKIEAKRYKSMLKSAKAETKASPEDPNAWYKLRLLLWIIGKYKEASAAFRTAKKLGWDTSSTSVVAL